MQKVNINMMKNQHEKDFGDIIYKKNACTGQMYAKVISDRRFNVAVPLGGNSYAVYQLLKDTLDDYVKFSYVDVIDLIDGSAESSRKNADGWTGTYTISSPPNYFTTTIGDKVNFTFSGSGFVFTHYSDTRGGRWKVTIDGVFHSNISTHVNAIPTVPNTTYRWQTIEGLEDKEHSVVLEFIGADPAYAPTQNGSAVAARGWFFYDNDNTRADKTIRILKPSKVEVESTRINVIRNSSNKEFAFLTKNPNDATQTSFFLPDHGTGTVFATSQQFLFDGVPRTDWTPSIYFPVTDVRIHQVMRGVHPIYGEVADITEVKTVGPRGISYQTHFQWKKDTLVNDGYVNMFPISRPFSDKLLTSRGLNIPAFASHGGRTYLRGEPIESKEYVYVHDSTDGPMRDIVALMTVHDIDRSFRRGQSNRLGDKDPVNTSMMWLEHRDATMQKLYPHVLNGHTFKAGDTYSFGATFFVGKLFHASRLLR